MINKIKKRGKKLSSKLSIIIPTYNCEKYIKRCIESLIIQKYINIEIIVIDDGSTDNTFDICNLESKKDSRIKIFRKKNNGVSSARNLGIEKATGEYIFFIDSDDYIEDNTIEECMKIIEDNDIDILKFGYYRECGKYKKKYKFSTINNKVINKQWYELNNIYSNLVSSSDFYNIWNAIIKKEIVSGLKFNETIKYGEDYLFMVELVFKSSSIYFYDKPFYHYCINNNAVTQIYKNEVVLKKINDICFSNNEIINLFKKNNVKLNKNDVYYNIIKLINADFKSLTYFLNYKLYCEIFNDVKKLKYYNQISKENDIFADNELKIRKRRYFYKNKITKTLRVNIKKIFIFFNNEV